MPCSKQSNVRCFSLKVNFKVGGSTIVTDDQIRGTLRVSIFFSIYYILVVFFVGLILNLVYLYALTRLDLLLKLNNLIKKTLLKHPLLKFKTAVSIQLYLMMVTSPHSVVLLSV